MPRFQVEDFLDDDGNWQCIQCGHCCRLFAGIALPKEMHKEDSFVCRHLENNLCTIYENRPDICNMSKSHAVLKQQGWSDEKIAHHTAEWCMKIANAAEEIKESE